MGLSKIKWTDCTWNPVTGCTKISPGCQNCYAERMAKRLAGRAGYPKDKPFSVTLHPDRLDEPLKWKKPSRVFVCSMGDLFHEDVPGESIEQVLIYAAMCSYHTFLILTKRPERMGEIFALWRNGLLRTPLAGDEEIAGAGYRWPLKNIWLGVTAENQEWFDKRWAYLKQIPAAKVFISYEPALGPVVLPSDFLERGNDAWVIAGGESGPGARPMHPNWARGLRDQCQAAGVPYFFKSWGEWAHATDYRKKVLCVYSDGRSIAFHRDDIMAEEKRSGLNHNDFNAMLMSRVGKKAAGRCLDEMEWDEIPEVR